MITEKSNRLQVIMITDYDYPISDIGKSFMYVMTYIAAYG